MHQSYSPQVSFELSPRTVKDYEIKRERVKQGGRECHRACTCAQLNAHTHAHAHTHARTHKHTHTCPEERRQTN